MATPRVLNEDSHLTHVRSLAHGIIISAFKECTRNPDGTLQKLVIWTSAAKTRKIRETLFTRAGNGSISTVTKIQYDENGNQTEQLLTTLTRDGSNRISTSTVTRS
jgi:hypothetical protein